MNLVVSFVDVDAAKSVLEVKISRDFVSEVKVNVVIVDVSLLQPRGKATVMVVRNVIPSSPLIVVVSVRVVSVDGSVLDTCLRTANSEDLLKVKDKTRSEKHSFWSDLNTRKKTFLLNVKTLFSYGSANLCIYSEV